MGSKIKNIIIKVLLSQKNYWRNKNIKSLISILKNIGREMVKQFFIVFQ